MEKQHHFLREYCRVRTCPGDPTRLDFLLQFSAPNPLNLFPFSSKALCSSALILFAMSSCTPFSAF